MSQRKILISSFQMHKDLLTHIGVYIHDTHTHRGEGKGREKEGRGRKGRAAIGRGVFEALKREERKGEY